MALGTTLTALAGNGRIDRVEPLSWWTGMQTPLQVMFHGPQLGACSVELDGAEGVRIAGVHRAESPNYLFVDVEIDPAAPAGRFDFLFTDADGRSFRHAYELAERRPGSRERQSFSSADMIYLLMPDRFADGDPSIDSTDDTVEKADRRALGGRHGGDLQGMIDHLDYIAGLGATAVWATPLLEDNQPRASYHGYACTDYYRIDPRFGTNELYRDYVRQAHAQGLKIIMDIVTNHCGSAHWWMADLPFADWVHQFDGYTQTNNAFSTNMDPHASQYDLRIQESGWFDTMMPDMNLDNPFVLRYFQQWAVWWIEYADLDGLRVDTYPYNERVPMASWCAAVRGEYPNLNIVGECWTSSIPQLAYWQSGSRIAGEFDSHLPTVMDFPLQEAICSALPTDSLRWNRGLVQLYNTLSHDFLYADCSKLLIFAGNHDTERLGDVVHRNPARAKIAMTLLATMRGIPQIFAGDEQLFVSADTTKGHIGLRVDFPGGWAGDGRSAFDTASLAGPAAELYRHTARLFNWRKHKPVIHSGRTLHFLARDNTYAYFRYNETEAVFVFVNNSRGAKRIPWETYAEITGSLHDGVDVLTGKPATVDASTTVGPREALVVEFRRDPQPTEKQATPGC